ncbi:hypothetical protein GA0070558_12958 [Micromonospora haikouensis]|uniref:Uncharacterized protein n=1 Tax=Micromonospora haikouensis TaxID=686309 RepID=A0A1C4XSZ1_9ACTN|nr:hypothetical protein [Micromonospora haikouensis]SCF11613.1 hypothetical protein GA0070558_12958 [Micromonospora haikouensis]
MSTEPIPPGYRSGRAVLIVVQVLTLLALVALTVWLAVEVVQSADGSTGTP